MKNEERHIRNAEIADIATIMAMVEHSRSVMRANGNHVQWTNGYPGEQELHEDIGKGIGRIIEEDGHSIGYFALLEEPEPTYKVIEGGRWLDDRTPYCTLHRLCCTDGVSGIARCAFDYCESRSESMRCDTHHDNRIMRTIIEERDYTYCGVVFMEDGSPRDAYQKMLYPMVRADLRHHVEQNILPEYDTFDEAHRRDHVQVVMAQSMELARFYPEVDKEVVYVVAAYHDLGIVQGRELHHIVSGKIVREDRRLQRWFGSEMIETIAQAVEDHRASAQQEPRSLYGRIVAEADRDIQPETIVLRTVQYGKRHYPTLDKEGHWKRTLAHLQEKYAPGGYLKLYIPHSRNKKELEKLWALIADKERLRQMFEHYYTTL